jgi:hypothetical protein
MFKKENSVTDIITETRHFSFEPYRLKLHDAAIKS